MYIRDEDRPSGLLTVHECRKAFMKKEKQETHLFSVSQEMGSTIAMWYKEEVFVETDIPLKSLLCIQRSS